MASFQPKTGWKWWRRRENKDHRSVPFLPDVLEKIRKKQKKIQKIKKIPLWLHFSPKQVGKGGEREKIKIIIPFRSYPTCQRKFEKNRKKFKNIKKYHYRIISSQNMLEKAEKARK